MSRASIIFSLFVALSVTVTASAQEEPKIKVYGNKTPTMIGTPEQIAKYRQELADKERLNDAQAYSYVDENGNRVTVQSNKNNNYGINYGGGFYYDGYWQGTNSNSNVAYPPPHWAPNSPNVATGPDGVPLEPPGGLPTPALPPEHGQVIVPPPPPHWAPSSPNVAIGPDGAPLEPPGGFPTPELP